MSSDSGPAASQRRAGGLRLNIAICSTFSWKYRSASARSTPSGSAACARALKLLRNSSCLRGSAFGWIGRGDSLRKPIDRTRSRTPSSDSLTPNLASILAVSAFSVQDGVPGSGPSSSQPLTSARAGSSSKGGRPLRGRSLRPPAPSAL